MEKYADYRTYLKFSMYEQTEDQDGNIKRITWMIWRGVIPEEKDRIRNMWRCWRDLLCSIINRQTVTPKIRLVLLDEAFSKMDKERSEVCLAYARKLGLQLCRVCAG
ncbi:MAG: hypothetical protein ACLTUL_20500 [Blautia faecis]